MSVPDSFMTSRLISRRSYNPGETLRKYVQVFTNVSKTLVQKLDGVMAGNLVARKQVAKIDEDIIGLNPAWRKALVRFLMPIAWPEISTLTENNKRKKRLQELTQELINITSASGAYFNEASPEERTGSIHSLGVSTSDCF